MQPKDASQLICVFSISCGEHQSAKCGACRGGGMEGVMPAPPAQEIKAPCIKGSCATQAAATAWWLLPSHSHYGSGSYF